MKEHAGLFDGCTEAISESGAFSFTVENGQRLYPVATGERGTAWMRLSATGTTGHGSKANPDNAVTRLSAALVSYGEAVEAPFAGRTVEAMLAALRAEDPDGHPIPYCMSGGTDAKWFADLGIAGYGFSPLLLPPELDYFGMFHGVDERVPVEGLRFGVRVLDRFFATC